MTEKKEMNYGQCVAFNLISFIDWMCNIIFWLGIFLMVFAWYSHAILPNELRLEILWIWFISIVWIIFIPCEKTLKKIFLEK